jgi:zinc protease
VARQYLGRARIELEVLRGDRAVRRYERELDPIALDHDVDVRSAPRNDVFDRSLEPYCAPTPRFVPPAMKTFRLSNGLEVRIVERHEMPRVTLKLVVKSGGTSVPRGKEGLDSIVVNLLEEGTRTRSTLQLEDDLLDAGATLSTSGLLESSIVTLTTATRRLEQALDLYADVILNPSFPDRELQRLKLGRLDLLEERSHSPEQIAHDVLPRLLYDPQHPYARAYLGTLESVRSITRQDVVEFYHRHFVPGNAALVVVGDVRPDAIVAALEARFGKWRPDALPPPPDVSPIPSPADSQTIYLIDKPGAEQSLLSVGWIGTGVRARAHSSLGILKSELAIRLERTLREEVGCSYGFRSSLPRRNGAAPLVFTGSVHKLDTNKALLEIFKVMNDLKGLNPVTEQEIYTIYDGMVPTWFDRFETNADVAGEVADLLSHGLPDRHWATELDRYAAVTENDASEAAKRYLTPSGMAILVVGDRAWVETLLLTVPSVKRIILLDSRVNPLPKPPR